MSKTWGFIGCGNLAQAIIRGTLSQGVLHNSQIYATNRSSDKLLTFVRETKIGGLESNEVLVHKSDILVLGMKPQDLPEAAAQIQKLVSPDHTIISLAAGVSSQTLKKYFPKVKGLIRVMGNTPAFVSRGVFGISFIRTDRDTQNIVVKVFESLGKVVAAKDDRKINAITAACASGVGFVFLFLEEFEKFLIKAGFPKALAKSLALETFSGAGELARSRPRESFKNLREAVTSKKGTTLAGLMAMDKKKLPHALQAGLHAALKRSEELSKELHRTRK